MALISIDNGITLSTAEEVATAITAPGMWERIVDVMDDALREAVHADMAPCTDVEFLSEYLRRATDNLIIG